MLYHPDLAVVFAYVRSTGLSLGSGQIWSRCILSCHVCW
jgi:hypothetical protein